MSRLDPQQHSGAACSRGKGKNVLPACSQIFRHGHSTGPEKTEGHFCPPSPLQSAADARVFAKQLLTRP